MKAVPLPKTNLLDPSKDKQECNFTKNILKDNSDLLQNLFLTSFF